MGGSSSRPHKKIRLSVADGDSCTTGAASVLDGLNDDALRAILVRTCAADHDSLRQTCKRFCRILNSFSFRQERGVFGYAEVQGVEFRSSFEEYQEECRKWQNREGREDDESFQDMYDELGKMEEDGQYNLGGFKAWIDGKRISLERTTVHLLPRRKVRNNWPSPFFFEICDSVDCDNESLKALAVACFSNWGRVRLPSLKAVVPASDRRPLLYISEFELPVEYRTLASTVGPMIIQSLLTQSPRLKDRWSIAMYIPSSLSQYTPQDRVQCNRMEYMLHPRNRGWTPLSEEEQKEKKDWYDRLEALSHQDMRQFFRAGFRPVSDTIVVEDQNLNYYVYTTPGLLQESSRISNKPIMSEQEALQVEIRKPPKDPPVRTAQERALFLLMREKSKYRQELVNQLADLQKKQESIRSKEAKISEYKDWLNDLDAHVKRKLQEFFQSATAASVGKAELIIKANAIHACVFYMVTQPYVQFLLDLLPPNEKVRALNYPDRQGATPLVMAAVTDGWATPELNEFNSDQRREMVAFLIQQGANKNAQNRCGLTALGVLRRSRRSDQANGPWGRPRTAMIEDELETLLMPTMGPSPADQAMAEEEDPSDDDIEGDFGLLDPDHLVLVPRDGDWDRGDEENEG